MKPILSTALAVLTLVTTSAYGQGSAGLAAGKAEFETRCGGCHGGDGKGGVRAPDVVTPGLVQPRSTEELRTLVREGLPDRGMPGFSVPEPAITHLVTYYLSLTAPAKDAPVSGDAAAGRTLFFGSAGCANCHAPGQRNLMAGPDLSSIAAQRTLGELATAVREPNAEIADGYRHAEVTLVRGAKLDGFIRNESLFDLQLETFDGQLRFLKAAEIASIARDAKSLMPAANLSAGDTQNILAYLATLDGQQATPATSGGYPTFSDILTPRSGDWPSYNGNIRGNRHSPLAQINTDNVAKLAPAWMFPLEAARELEMTPVVVDGVMYVTALNTVAALDAANGRQIWKYSRPATPGVMGDAGSGANRGVAVLGNFVFYVTDHAHMIAIDRATGQLRWDTEMADFREHYGGTLAPLVVGDVVVGGVGGGDEGIRGFLAAFDVKTGKEAWRFWTIPLPGEPLAATWKGSVLPHGCGGTWLTGTYDPELDTLYWPVGNPCPDMNGDVRLGDNLYSDSMLALDPKTGKLKWYFQYTPHDEFDWDANQTPVLVDAEWEGQPRKLLLHANRNGFFYVLDRTNGKLLRGAPFVEQLDWASGLDPKGRPILAPDKRPTPAGNIVCPGLAGATNWMSPAYNPNTGLYVVQASEYCQIFSKREEKWQLGKQYFGGAAKNVPGEPSAKYLRAIDIATGEIKWDLRQYGPARTWGGVLSTDGGLTFYGDDSGALAAVRSADGKPVWHFHLNSTFRASPMTYTAGGKQYVAIGSGTSVVAFALNP